MRGRLFTYCLWVMSCLVSSCAHYKDIPYFQNSVTFDGSKNTSRYDLTIKPKDRLNIFVFSGNDKDAVSVLI